MKSFSQIFCLSFLLFSLPAISQIDFDEEKGAASMTVVKNVENATIDEMFERARLWVVGNLKSSDNQIFFDEENHQHIIATGNLLLNNKALQINRSVNFKLSVFFKEDRYKLVIDQMILDVTNTSLDGSNQARVMENVNDIYQKYTRKNKKNRYKVMDELDEELGNLAENFHKALSLEAVQDSSDW